MYGQFGDLTDAGAVRKLCRVLREEQAIFELQVSNRRECRRRRYRGSARISLWLGCRSRLCRAELSEDAQHAKQENRDDLQSLSSEKYDANLFPKQMRHVPACVGGHSQHSTTHQSARTLRIHTLYLVMRNFSGKMLVPADSKMHKQRVQLRSRAPRAWSPMRSRLCPAWPESWEAHERGMKEPSSPQTTAKFRSTMVDWHQACCRNAPCEPAKRQAKDLSP